MTQHAADHSNLSPAAHRIWASAGEWGLSDNDAYQGIAATLCALADHELESPTSGPWTIGVPTPKRATNFAFSPPNSDLSFDDHT